MSISGTGKLEVAKWVSPWHVEQLTEEEKTAWYAHLTQWEQSPDPFPGFYAAYDINQSRQFCVDVIVAKWDTFQDVFTFPTTPLYRIGHPIKRMAHALGITDPAEFINLEYLVIPQGYKVNPKNGGLVLAASLNNSGQCSYENNVALGTKHVKMADGKIYNSIAGDHIATIDHFEQVFQEYPTAPGQDLNF